MANKKTMRQIVCELWFCMSVRLSVCPYARLSVCPSVRLPSVCPSVRLHACTYVGYVTVGCMYGSQYPATGRVGESLSLRRGGIWLRPVKTWLPERESLAPASSHGQVAWTEGPATPAHAGACSLAGREAVSMRASPHYQLNRPGGRCCPPGKTRSERGGRHLATQTATPQGGSGPPRR